LSPADVVVAGLLAISLYTDMTRQKILNVVTFSGMLLGIVANATGSNGMGGDILVGPLGIAVAFALMFPGFLFFGSIRAGDAKLLMAVGAWLGAGEAIRACLLTYVLSLPFGLTVLAVKGRLGNLVTVAKALVKRTGGDKDVEMPEGTVVPFAIVIALAVLITRTTEVFKWW